MRSLIATLGATVLAACGGGDSSGPSISSMSAAPTAYGRIAVWTVSGFNLDGGISLHISEGRCDSVAEAGGGTAIQRQFICRVASLGDLAGQINDLSGKRLASLRVSIPAPLVQLALSQGNIELALDPLAAPITVNNFLNYVNNGFYNNTLFHRVIGNFVIQGGGFTPGTPGTPDPVFKNPTQPPITLESNNGLSNKRASLAMARTGDPNSATSQFYINVADNLALDYQSNQQPGYAVFGEVTTGMALVDAIRVVPTRDVPGLGLEDVPVTDVIVTTARQIQ